MVAFRCAGSVKTQNRANEDIHPVRGTTAVQREVELIHRNAVKVEQQQYDIIVQHRCEPGAPGWRTDSSIDMLETTVLLLCCCTAMWSPTIITL